VDAALVAFLSLAEVTHHLADLAEQEGDRARAEAILRALFDGPLPGDPPLGPEVREVLGDTLARLAEQASARGELEAARRDIARGLQLASERTLYRGRLMEVLGVVEQRDHEALLAEGRLEEAEAAKKRAIEAFERAVEIQDDVIRSVLGDDLPLP
jgi:tetratricopeptide (TPR) repeat protein